MSAGDTVDLDEGQYALAGIQKYESVYGRHFVSPGGEAMARECIARLRLEPGERVLDVGCGLGGAAFLMAREHGVTVHGLDLSANMIALARERCAREGLGERVSLEQGDCLALAGEDVYDAVYSRDVFLHVADKERLLAGLLRVLRPGGRLLFTDYCRDAAPASDAFRAYVAARGYTLATVEEYRRLLEQAGFVSVRAHDWTARFVDINERELAALGASGLDAAGREALARDWRAKIERARAGEQRWGCFEARKPG
ncbi:MAG: methyltransferase domain-containing protein [Gammaproteobacteria bacterium]|nr:methyltransferase domain-containing protein [Gammaproteobacteria bacterium]